MTPKESQNSERTLLSVGHGYTASALAFLLQLEGGWKIIGTTRSESNRRRIEDSGVSCRVWPGHDLACEFGMVTHLLMSAPPGEHGDPLLAELASVISEASSRLAWIGYLSTTAVYGDRRGGWVTESDETSPQTQRGLWRKSAEDQWLGLFEQRGLPVHIFRLAGIYGLGRGPLHQLRTGKKKQQVVKPGQVFNRIHVEDIARVLSASIEKPRPGAVYNLSDDCPAPPEEVADYAAELLGMTPPPRVSWEQATLSPMAKSFYGESKRVSNMRVKQDLGIQLLYPSYRSGLKSLI